MLWNLFPFVLVVFMILVVVSLFQEDEIVLDNGVLVMSENVVGW